MDRAVDQQLDESVRSHNAATRVIEDNQDALGKQNLDKLQKAADQIALASYIVHVRMPGTKRNLDASLADASTVKSTLEHDQERAKAVLDDPHASKAAKMTADKRSAAAANALAALDPEIADAKKQSDEMEKRTQAAQNDYEQALRALRDDIRSRADAAAKNGASKK
jgi:formamidopyrimidine-DNA glycosylase